MHRNTVLLIVFLAVVVSLLVGLRISFWMNPQEAKVVNPSPTSVSISPTPSPILISYESDDCLISFEYPQEYTLSEGSSSAILVNQMTQETIRMVCGTEFPIPPLTDDRIEEATIVGQLATIYHDASAKDGTPLDVVMFDHPEYEFVIALFGYGDVFEKLLNSLTLR